MFEWAWDSFLWRALLGGIGVALITGPLGCFVVWQRMSYFGSTLAHSALLGVMLALWLQIQPVWGMLLVCLLLAWVLTMLFERSRYTQEWSGDVILGVVAHTVLALGLIVLSKMEQLRVDLNALLFGDVLAITVQDLWSILIVGVIVYAVLSFIWKQLLEITLSEEIAAVEGIPVRRIRQLYLLLLALVVAVAVKVVGMLLLMSLLIIPAAVARKFSSTPERMAVLACVFGVVSVIGGLCLSVYLDWPASAAIAIVASAFFVVSVLKK
ncbi:MAG TPA: iron chelate uptake ABC transporter family permease subunit [Gammaproteobacteria bacterium]